MPLPFRFRRGLLANLPVLTEGEPAITNDTGTERMYFGTSSGNKRVALYSDLETGLVASNVTFSPDTPGASLVATNVQDAIDEVDSNEQEIRDLIVAHTAETNNPHDVTKTQIGLGNVDNTSDANKPVSTAQQTALDLKRNIADDTPTNSYEFWEDFDSGTATGTSSTSGTIGRYRWLQTASGGTTTITYNNHAISANVHGSIRLQRSGASSLTVLYTPIGTTNPTFNPSAPNTTFMASVASVDAAVSDKQIIVGFYYAGTIASYTPTSGIYFQASNAGNWVCITRTGVGTYTETDSGVAQSTSFQKLMFTVSADGLTVRFYIDGGLVATHTTHIPSAFMYGVISIGSITDTDTLRIDCDYFHLKTTGITR